MSKETIKRINDIVGRINTHPEYSSSVAAHYGGQLRAEADRHSTGMEIQEGTRISRKTLDEIREKSLRNMEEAHRYLASEGLSVFTLTALGNLVEPENHPYKMFRRNVQNTNYAAGDIEFPHSSKVIDLTRGLVDYLNEESSVHPVVRAANAHLSLVSIHPYEDGNGRVARLVERFCLEQRGHPPAIITTDERPIYIHLLNPAVKSWLQHKNPFIAGENSAEEAFFTFIETKVLQSAQKLEEELRRRRVYDVEMDIRQKPRTFAVKKIIESYGAAHQDRNIHARILQPGERNHSALEIRGDVSLDELKYLLSKVCQKQGAKFAIVPRKGCA